MKWFIPDCYWPATDHGEYVSHEAVCVLNTNDTAASVFLTLYFEDREKLSGFSVNVESERTAHIRLDKLLNRDGLPVPRATPYAIVLECDLEITVQYTRVDTTQPELTIATTIV